MSLSNFTGVLSSGASVSFTMDKNVFSAMILVLIALALAGIVTNIINIIIFSKMAFQSTTNITLLAMGVSDLFVCFTLLCGLIMETHWLQLILLQNFRLSPSGVSVLCFIFLQGIFSKVTNELMGIITFERCLCVALPLKVKTILTPGRIKAAVVCAYILVVVDIIPYYYVHRLRWTHSPYFNTTLLGLYFTDQYLQVMPIYLLLDSIIFYFIFFTIIIVCTVILIVSLRKNMKWRQTTTTENDAKNVSNKEMKIAKMVAIISAIFIVCYIPAAILGFLMTFAPTFFSFQNQNLVVLQLFSYCVSLLQAISSSTNLFVYYFNNSSYKTMFDAIFVTKSKEISKNSSK